jgi:hypothetical protein
VTAAQESDHAAYDGRPAEQGGDPLCPGVDSVGGHGKGADRIHSGKHLPDVRVSNGKADLLPLQIPTMLGLFFELRKDALSATRNYRLKRL